MYFRIHWPDPILFQAKSLISYRVPDIHIRSCPAEMSGLSYFAIQIQSWIFKTQSKSNPSPTFFEMKSPSPNKVYQIDKNSFLITNITQFFPINAVQSGPNPKFMKQFTVRFQSIFNKIRHSPGPGQCSSLVSRLTSGGHLWLLAEVATDTDCRSQIQRDSTLFFGRGSGLKKFWKTEPDSYDESKNF